MTNLIIHTDLTLRREYLISQVNALLGTDYSTVAQLHTNPDLHIIEQPEHVSVKLDDVKLLQKDMQFKPFAANYQIGIIFHAKMLTVEAQNALLKTLEEQSEETMYYLLVNSERSVLPTIVSRSIKHYVKGATSVERVKSDEEIPHIINQTLVEQFQAIEKWVEEEKEQKGVIQDQLNKLYTYYQVKLEEQIINKNLVEIRRNKEIIGSIQVANERLNANVNKRLLLENLMLQLKDINEQ